MRCDDIRDRLDDLWEAEAAVEARRHIEECPSCARLYHDLGLVRAGLRLWKADKAPEPSLGFAQRLVRQLGELSRAPSVADFFERAGRRFVYATLVLTCLALLALVVPATGPLRGLTMGDIQTSSQEAALSNSDPMGEAGTLESPELAPSENPAPSAPNEVK